MARKNKPVAVEINELDDSVSQIIINKVILGTVDEKDSPLVCLLNIIYIINIMNQ
jgi:hypothetical protein